MQESPLIFALDIGTRSVVGIILKETTNGFEILDIVTKEHKERAMVDGQIHDVLEVAKVIQEIKNELEELYGPLTKVCVAAAGRALKTKRTIFEVDIVNMPMISEEDILRLELSAVQQAQNELANETAQETKSNDYYCVGYSVMHYKLDGEEIGNLIDQEGKVATVEIIATFLPKVVVDSLIAALQRANLEMEALTLEPIAAINVLIPRSMRRLNVALVDIGAGTSDIAITNHGTIVAYGMVPIAGDEITEAVSDHYLLDFPLAEKAKREINDQETVTIMDILGLETSVPRRDMIQSISSAVEKLASAISEEILSLNGESPKAVMLIGGGSLTPTLPQHIARKLNLPDNRVAIRDLSVIQDITFKEAIKQGPELVTPIGIAIAARKSPVQYLNVIVNGRNVRLFDVKNLTIGDCLLAAGIELKKLYGRPGLAKFIRLNGNDITLPGELGTPPSVMKNNKEASFKTPIQNGDEIEILKGTDGTSPTVTTRDLIDVLPRRTISFNGKTHYIDAHIIINGELKNPDIMIEDGDRIETVHIQTVKDFLKKTKGENWFDDLDSFKVDYNGDMIELLSNKKQVIKNKKPVSVHSIIQDNDIIELVKAELPTLLSLVKKLEIEIEEELPVFFNGEKVLLKKQRIEFYRNGEKLTVDDVLQPNDHIQSLQKTTTPFIFQDIFIFIDLELPVGNAGGFSLTLNGSKTSFNQELSANDELEIIWEKKTTSETLS